MSNTPSLSENPMQEMHLWIPVHGVSTEVLCTSDATEEQSGHVEASSCADRLWNCHCLQEQPINDHQRAPTSSGASGLKKKFVSFILKPEVRSNYVAPRTSRCSKPCKGTNPHTLPLCVTIIVEVSVHEPRASATSSKGSRGHPGGFNNDGLEST